MGCDVEVAMSVLMSEYNQQYSEIEEISMEDVSFLLKLHEAKNIYRDQEIKRASK